MNERAILVIQRYMDEYLFTPSVPWPVREFKERSYARWAAMTTIERIMDNPFKPADLTVEELLIEFSLYASNEEMSGDNYIFATAKDTIIDILGLL